MPEISIASLKEKWEFEKDYFRIHELGTMQDFIKDIFICDELFGLKYDLGSKDIKKRKNEITRETRKEITGRGRADIVIYIDGEDIVIPVEVEKFGHITAGESQILQYQTDWRKKYGILTDGYEWRLYYDRYYDNYTLEDIFNKKSNFWRKWALYTSPENYYDMTFNPKGQFDFFETDRLDLNKAENRPFFFNDITSLLHSFRHKIVALMPIFEKDKKLTIEMSYSYLIQFILYKVLIDNEYEKQQNNYHAFRERIKKAIKNKEFYDIIIEDIKNISEYIYKNIYKPFRKRQEGINKGLIAQLKKTPTLEEIAPWLDIIMFIDRYNFANIKNELFGFVYENYLKELYSDENKGQYFTDPAVVNFMLSEMGYTSEKLAKDKEHISIIDPSCGAGTFLYSAVENITNAFYTEDTVSKSKEVEALVNNNVFGLDVEDFPLFLAEMNILMRLLPIIANSRYQNPIEEKLKIIKTKDSIAEFLDTPIARGGIKNDEPLDLFAGLTEKHINSYMRDDEDLKALFLSLQEDLAGWRRFDYVIGNPPYIGYNECSKQKMAFIVKLQNQTDKSINMGNVYGVNLNSTPLLHKKNTPKPNLYAFFIALGVALLKDNGKICYIIPQNILQSRDLDVIRYFLSKSTTIEKIITFGGNLFIGRGLKQTKPVATSSLIFLVKKAKPAENHKVTVVNYEDYNEKQAGDLDLYFKTGRNSKRSFFQSELLSKIENWNFIKQDDAYLDFTNKYLNNSHSIEEYRLQDLNNYDDVCFDIGYNIDESKLSTIQEYYIFPLIEKDYLTIKHARGYFPKNGAIKLLRSNQGHKLLAMKYKILWNYNNPDKFHFSDMNLISARNKICFIGSNDKRGLMFLFAVLNSGISKTILLKSLKVANEKALLVGLSSVKQYIRIPKIDTTEKKAIKAEIITQTEKMLALEKPVLHDIVDFSGITMQKFETVQVVGNTLILSHSVQKYECRIASGKSDLVNKTIRTEYFPKDSLFPVKEIILGELKFLPAINFEAQSSLKAYIDDLVFALYFNVPLPTVSFAEAAAIRTECGGNEFYGIISGEGDGEMDRGI